MLYIDVLLSKTLFCQILFNLIYISPLSICRFHMILSFINFWVIDVYILYPMFPCLFSEMGGECLYTHIVGMMPEVHACLLQLAEGVEPLVIQPVHHIHPTSGWLHNQLTFQTNRRLPLISVELFHIEPKFRIYY